MSMQVIERFALRGGGSVRVSVTEDRSVASPESNHAETDACASVFKLRDGTVLDQLGAGRLQDPRNGESYQLVAPV